MTTEPRVTVGVPVYNGERFLEVSLASLAAQTLGDVEIVILDNASTDGTAEIAEAFVHRDARFRYERHATNIGPVANYNALVGLARAPLFKWQATDDRLEPAYLERCVAVLDQDPGLVLATTRLELFDENGRPLASEPDSRYRVTPDGERVLDRPSIGHLVDRPSASDRFHNVLHDMFGIQISTYMYGVIRTNVLQRTALEGPYPGGDKVLLAELALHGRFCELPEVLWSCRIHPAHLGALPPSELERRLRRPGPRPPVSTMRFDQLRGYVSAIRRAPIGAHDRLRCLRALLERGRAVRTSA
jgi:glycosyltransferase involved in cell wall biosynthesis